MMITQKLTIGTNVGLDACGSGQTHWRRWSSIFSTSQATLATKPRKKRSWNPKGTLAHAMRELCSHDFQLRLKALQIPAARFSGLALGQCQINGGTFCCELPNRNNRINNTSENCRIPENKTWCVTWSLPKKHIWHTTSCAMQSMSFHFNLCVSSDSHPSLTVISLLGHQVGSKE